MSQKVYTVAIIGTGARGAGAYGRIIHNNMQDKLKIVALCDKRQDRLDRWSEFFGVDKANCFLDEDEFFAARRADALIVGTQGTLSRALRRGMICSSKSRLRTRKRNVCSF